MAKTDIEEMQLVTQVLNALNRRLAAPAMADEAAQLARPGIVDLAGLEDTIIESIKEVLPAEVVESEDVKHAVAFANVIAAALRAVRLVMRAP